MYRPGMKSDKIHHAAPIISLQCVPFVFTKAVYKELACLVVVHCNQDCRIGLGGLSGNRWASHRIYFKFSGRPEAVGNKD
jgi:hypothetical protein